MLTAFTVLLIVALILLVALIDILRVSLSVNTLLAVQVMMNAKEGQRTIFGPVAPRPGTGLLARAIHHVEGKLHERMILRAYLRAAPMGAALRTKLESRSSEQQ